jgi:hypothetical protein
MPRQPPIEQQLLELSALRRDASSTTAREKLTSAISGKNNLLAARAAAIIEETRQADYLPALAAAFERFFTTGTDKGCTAKQAIASAMYTLGHTDTAAFLRGIRHVQMEATYGGSVDAAAELRGTCALGLVRCGYRDVLLELAGLLMDKEQQPRQMAARAIAYAGSEEGAPLLRMKVLAGDRDADVTAECFNGLMKLTPAKSIEFLARFLDADDPATAESAALALGASRLPAAINVLMRQWTKQVRPEPRRPLLLAIAMTRQSAAIDFLMERVLDDSPGPAADAVASMEIYKHDDAIRLRLAAIVRERDSAAITAAFNRAFAHADVG